MSSSEDVVNKMLGDLSRIPSSINSNVRIKEQNIDEIVRKKFDEQLRDLKSRGIL